jgi:hypothetical protein
VVDGRDVGYLESALTAEEYQTIKEQSVSRVNVPQMHVNLEELFPSRSFSPPMLYRMRDKFLKDKYSADGHDLNLTDLFTKAETIKNLGGRFVVVPSSTDFSIETIHCQTQLMGEYARIYGGFKMADGTHMITRSDETRYFTAYVYSYDPVSGCVSRDIRDGLIHDVHVNGSACIVFIDDRITCYSILRNKAKVNALHISN